MTWPARLRTNPAVSNSIAVKDVLSKFKVVGVIETNMGLGSVSSGGVLYGEVCAALYESAKRPLVLSFMAGMGGEAIVLEGNFTGWRRR